MHGAECPEKTAETSVMALGMEREEGEIQGEQRDQSSSSKRTTGACPCCRQDVTRGIVMSWSGFVLRAFSEEYGSKYKFYGSRRTQKERV